VKNFDVSRGGSFTTYAHSYVRGAILDSRELTRNLGRRQQEICEEIKRAEQVLAHRLERIPTKEEVASETGLSVEQILNAIDAMGLAFARDLSEDAEPSASRAAGPPQETAALIHDALARLTEREQLIVADHYFEGLSDAEIALRHNMTKDSAKKTRQRAIKKLRRLLDEGSGGS
jgi:RNA polymerase sigma factor for flagellar operon FliA